MQSGSCVKRLFWTTQLLSALNEILQLICDSECIAEAVNVRKYLAYMNGLSRIELPYRKRKDMSGKIIGIKGGLVGRNLEKTKTLSSSPQNPSNHASHYASTSHLDSGWPVKDYETITQESLLTGVTQMRNNTLGMVEIQKLGTSLWIHFVLVAIHILNSKLLDTSWNPKVKVYPISWNLGGTGSTGGCWNQAAKPRVVLRIPDIAVSPQHIVLGFGCPGKDLVRKLNFQQSLTPAMKMGSYQSFRIP